MKKYILGLIGVLSLLTLLTPAVTRAVPPPDGTADNPYLITTCIELQAIPEDVPKGTYYELDGPEGTIDCSLTNTWNDDGDGGFYGFDPIAGFAGTLLGNDNIISGLYIHRPSEDNVGLFAYLSEGANVSQFTLENVDMNGSAEVGALVGYLENINFTITNVSASGGITGAFQTGGLVGTVFENVNHAGTITGGEVSVNVNVGLYYAGGLVGEVDMVEAGAVTIDDVYVHGNILATAYIGGFIGYMDVEDDAILTIADSSWGDGTATMNAENDVGGFIGYAYLQGATFNLTGLEATVKMDPLLAIPSSDVGGVIGYVEQAEGGEVTIEDSTITLDTPGEQDIQNIGGVVGHVNSDDWNSAGSVVNIFSLDIAGTIDSSNDGVGGAVGYFEGRDSQLHLYDVNSSVNVAGRDYVGGILGDYYMEYSSSIILNGVSSGLDGATLEGGVDVGGIIGYGESMHGGTVTINDSSANYGDPGQITFSGDYGFGGMIGEVYGRFVSNVTIIGSNAYIDIDVDDTSATGGLIGYVLLRYGSTLSIDSVQTDGTLTVGGVVEETDALGGFIGEMDAKNSVLSISDSSNGIDINAAGATLGAYYIGGFLGDGYEEDKPFDINITSSENTGNIIVGNGHAYGGFIGQLEAEDDPAGTLSIDASTNSGNIIASTDEGSDVGGFVGASYDYNVEINDSNAFTEGPITLDASYDVGGFIGNIELYNGEHLTISGSTADITKDDFTVEIEDMGGLVGSLYTNSSAATITDSSTTLHLYSEEDGPGGYYYVGGLIGYSGTETGSSLTIERSHSDGIVGSTLYTIGGLIGQAYLYDDEGYPNTLDITESYSSLDVPWAENSVGGLIADLHGDSGSAEITITDSNYDGEIGNSDDVTQIGEGFAGGLIGTFDPGCCTDGLSLTISGSSSTGDISAHSNEGGEVFIGGLIGFIYEDVDVTIEDSFSTSNLKTDPSGYSVGGLVGENFGDLTINRSYATGSVEGLRYIGGLVGDSSVLTIDNSYATGNVTGTNALGGLVGWAETLHVDHSYATGNVSATTTDSAGNDALSNGGLVGYGNDGTISNSFAAGNVSVGDESSDYTTGFVGEYWLGELTLVNNFYDRDRAGQAHCSYNYDGILEQVPNDTVGECEAVNVGNATPNYFKGADVATRDPFKSPGSWDFDTVWKTNVGGYPTLQQVYHITSTAGSHGSISPSGVVSLEEGDTQVFTITADDDYEIEDVTVDGESQGAVDEYTFENVSDNHTISVSFVSITPDVVTYTLTTSVGGAGTGIILKSPSGTTFDAGTEVTLTAVAAAKSTFKQWSNCSISTSTSISVTMSSNKTCVATFNKAGSSGGSSSGGGGGGSVSNSSSNTTTTTTTNVTPGDCKAGQLFSASTGKPCSGSPISIPGCSASQILTQNMHAPTRNGVYSSYTGAIVTEVKILQAHMNRLGFNSGPEDGILGVLTDAAIKRMQKFLGTVQDGYVGPITRSLINNSCGSAGLHQ